MAAPSQPANKQPQPMFSQQMEKFMLPRGEKRGHSPQKKLKTSKSNWIYISGAPNLPAQLPRRNKTPPQMSPLGQNRASTKHIGRQGNWSAKVKSWNRQTLPNMPADTQGQGVGETYTLKALKETLKQYHLHFLQEAMPAKNYCKYWMCPYIIS